MTFVRPRILAIDDTPANLMVLGRALSEKFNFQMATSGTIGLELARANRPDLILIDVMMPDVDGYEICRQFKADPDLAQTPLVFVTALSDKVAELRGLSLGAVDYIYKPFNVEIAFQRINNLLELDAMKRAIARHRDELEQQVAERTKELEAANVALIEAREIAEHASKVKSAFLAKLSHELRTPLGVILGMVELLARAGLDVASARRVQTIGQSGRDLLSMVDSLLLVARTPEVGRSLSPMDFSPVALLDDLVSAYRAQAISRGIELKTRIQHGIPEQMLSFPTALREILRHILENALKFSNRGEVVLEASREIDVHGAAVLRLLVRDQGPGIDPQRLAKMFQPFAQGDESPARAFGGLGLGLSLARHHAAQAGVHLGVQSRPGEGSSFWIDLPLPASPEIAPGPVDVPPAARAQAARQLQFARLRRLLEEQNTLSCLEWQAASAWLPRHLGDRAEPVRQAIERYAFGEALRLLDEGSTQ